QQETRELHGLRIRRHDGRPRPKISFLPASIPNSPGTPDRPQPDQPEPPPRGGGLFLAWRARQPLTGTPSHACREPHRGGGSGCDRFQIPNTRSTHFASFRVFLTIRLDLKWPRGYTPR